MGCRCIEREYPLRAGGRADGGLGLAVLLLDALFGGPSSGGARDRSRENPGARSIWGEPRGHQPGTCPQKRRSPRRGVVWSWARPELHHLGLQKVSGYGGGAGRPVARMALLPSCPSASFWAAVFEAADTLRVLATALPRPPP